MKFLCHLLLIAAFPSILFRTADAAISTVVDEANGGDLRFSGKPWEHSKEGLSAEGINRLLQARSSIGEGDFKVKVEMRLERIDGSAASFRMGDSHFGFDGKSGTLFVEGDIFGAKAPLSAGPTPVKAGQRFVFECIREKDVTRFLIDQVEVYRIDGWTEGAGVVGLRPWRNKMVVSRFIIEGNLSTPQALPSPLFLSDFAGGNEGYHTYRIPALAVTPKGTVIAICEGRKHSWGDSGDIDLVMKRSTDQGKTWSAHKVIWDDGANTCGNPCVVVDKETGSLFLLATWNRGDDHEGEIIAQKSQDTRRVYVMRSDDDGASWSKPEEITASVKKPDWTWYATGPGSGIQMEKGAHSGRLVIPCDHIEAGTKHYYSHVIFSDDHGKTWQLGGSTPQHQVNECEVVELSDGKLMLNMRSYRSSQRMRQTAVSEDGGMTWSDQKPDPELIEPICQAAIERYSWPQSGKPGLILFSNPASTQRRERMTLRASMNDGESWPVSKLLHDGASGYSDLDVLADGRIACLFEGGEENIAESVIFTAIPIEDVTGPEMNRAGGGK